MDNQNILRLPRLTAGGDDDGFILLSVQADGSHPLDLKLVGTDNEAVFVTSIRQGRIKSIRSSNNPDDSAAWEAVLKHSLRGNSDPAHSEALLGLEFVADVKDNGLTLVWRRKIGRHIQRLGELTLPETNNIDMADLFQWTAVAAAAASSAQEIIQGLESKLRDQQQVVAKLSGQLDDLIKAKSEHENALLQKFSELLNSKKLKIRDQQRLLASANIDAKLAKDLQQAPGAAVTRKPEPSRPSKRKAKSKAVATAEEESESDGFADVQMREEEAAEVTRVEEEDMAEPITPEKSDLDETEDEDTDEAASASAPAQSPPRTRPGKRGIGRKGKAFEDVTQETRKGGTRSQTSQHAKSKEAEAPPPRRELPFTGAKQKKPSTQRTEQPLAAEDDETDDEL